MAVCDTAEKEVSTVSDKEVVLAGSVFQKAHSMSHSGRTPTNQPHILDMVLLLTNGKKCANWGWIVIEFTALVCCCIQTID
jgi:hypothetical protein